MRIDKPIRGRSASKRLDLSDIKHVLRDTRRWVSIGLIVQPIDGSAHWRLEPSDDGSSAVDVLVDVVLQPSQIPVTARLAAGFFLVPDIGEEVIVVAPEGEIDFMPSIVALLSSNSVPTVQGPSPSRIVIIRSEVLVHDGAGGAEPLVRKSDFDGHTHGAGTLTAPGGGGPVTGISGGAAAVPGTQVLKGK